MIDDDYDAVAASEEQAERELEAAEKRMAEAFDELVTAFDLPWLNADAYTLARQATEQHMDSVSPRKRGRPAMDSLTTILRRHVKDPALLDAYDRAPMRGKRGGRNLSGVYAVEPAADTPDAKDRRKKQLREALRRRDG
jgi:hypothetical protein